MMMKQIQPDWLPNHWQPECPVDLLNQGSLLQEDAVQIKSKSRQKKIKKNIDDMLITIFLVMFVFLLMLSIVNA